MRPRAYYAHCLAIYNTPQEQRDLEMLTALGYDVDNPNSRAVAAEVERRKHAGDQNYMEYFRTLIVICDVVVFRALPDGRIPAGIFKELQYAREYGRPVLELPSNVLGREMSLEHTREYLKEVGQR